MGHIISEIKISTDPEKLKQIQEWARPQTQNDVQSLLGNAMYYRKFIKGFAHLSDPLNKLLQKDHPFQWNEACEQAFNSLTTAFCEIVTLKFRNFSKPFIVDIDASDVGIGAVPSQLNEVNVEQPVGYYSRSISKSERKYAVNRKEMLALVEALRHFRCYLLGKILKVRTDHSALQWLRTFRDPGGQVPQWIERLAEYDFDLVHCPGKQHSNADALLRYSQTVVAISGTEHWLSPQLKNEFRKSQA